MAVCRTINVWLAVVQGPYQLPMFVWLVAHHVLPVLSIKLTAIHVLLHLYLKYIYGIMDVNRFVLVLHTLMIVILNVQHALLHVCYAHH
jgi:hypothetical protein